MGVAYLLEEKLLVSYNDELIYTFEKSMGLGASPLIRPHNDTDKVGPELDVTEPQVCRGTKTHKLSTTLTFLAQIWSTSEVVQTVDGRREASRHG